MKKIYLIISALGLAVLNGCSSTNEMKGSDLLVPATTATGGVIGMYASQDMPIAQQMALGGLGAGAGFAIGSAGKYMIDKEKAAEFETGYYLGRRHAQTQLRGIDQQLSQARSDKSNIRYKLYQLPVSNNRNGVNYSNSVITVPIAE